MRMARPATPRKQASRTKKQEYTPEDLSAAIRLLPEDERQEDSTVWYRSQKEHWLGWLAEYDGPGAYGRKGGNRTARFVYNHIVNPDMLLWLIATSNVPEALVDAAVEASCARDDMTLMEQAAAVRKHVPWDVLAMGIGARGRNPSAPRHGHPDAASNSDWRPWS